MNATGKLLIVLTIFLIALVAWSVYLGFTGSPFDDLPPNELRAYRLRAWIEPFFELLPVAVISAIVITFSLAVTVYDLGGEGTIINRTTGSLMVVLVLGMLNAFWVLFLDPQLSTRIEEIRHRGEFIRQLESDIRRDMAIPDRREYARDRVAVYRAVLGDDANDHEVLRDFEDELGGAGSAGDTEEESIAESEVDIDDPEGDAPILSTRERTVLDLIEDAREAQNANDFFSAHYLATQAIELDNGGDLTPEARRIAAQTWEAIRSQSREIEEAAERSVFEQKMAAFEQLQLGVRGEGSPERLFEAYYRFERLHELVPDDPDVQRYRAETATALERVSFFVEDATLWANQPASYDLFFRNRGGHDGEEREFVWIGRVTNTPAGTWLYDVEVLRLSSLENDMPRIVHYAADFGLYLVDPISEEAGAAPDRTERTGRILLRAIRREGSPATEDQPVDPDNLVIPMYYSGEVLPVLEETVRLTVPLNDLMQLAGGPERVVRMPLPELLRARESFDVIGGDVSIIWREIAARSLRVFGFFAAAYWAIAISWKYRSAYLGRAPIPIYLVVPTIPVAVYLIVLILRQVLVDAMNGLMLGVEFDGTIVISVIVASILALLGAFVVLGRQSVGP